MKSRATTTVIEGCAFDDGQDGETSYLVDLPNGGWCTIRNSRLHQSVKASNGTLIAVGLEGAYPDSSVLLENNEISNDYPGGTVLKTGDGVVIRNKRRVK